MYHITKLIKVIFIDKNLKLANTNIVCLCHIRHMIQMKYGSPIDWGTSEYIAKHFCYSQSWIYHSIEVIKRTHKLIT